MQGAKVEPGPKFPNYYDKQWSLHPPILMDAAPFGKKFGDVKTDVDTTKTYKVVRVLCVLLSASKLLLCSAVLLL